MKKGFTLIETLVTIAIFGLAIAAVSGLVIYFYRVNFYTLQQAYAINDARKGIEVATREIRETTYSATGAYPVVDAQPNSFTFYSDIGHDGNVEKVRYFLDNTYFKRNEVKAAGSPLTYPSFSDYTILSQYILNGAQSIPIFHYYNASSTEITDLTKLTDIKMVRVTLIVNIETSRPVEEFTIESSSQLRNLYVY